MRLLFRVVIYLFIFIITVGGVGAVGSYYTMRDLMAGYGEEIPSLQVKTPVYDPKKPTVAVILGNEVTEVFDFLVPYEMFSRTNAFNVFAVAPARQIKSLTGGLDVVPHYSFKEMDDLLGKSPDILVLPAIPIMDQSKYMPVREWIRKHSSNHTTILTICTGAENLADTSLLKGRSAATHWGDIGRLEKEYPEIQWKRDQRYVSDGNVVSSAGLTSGIDAVLHVISQKVSKEMALKIVEEMNYPSIHFFQNPKMEAYSIEPSDAVYLLNNAFQWQKKGVGLLLYNGIDEVSLASVFDTYGASGTTKIYTVSVTEQPIITKHHLNLLARSQFGNIPKVEKIIVSGAQANSLAANEVRRLQTELGHDMKVHLLHSDDPQRFVMEVSLEELARDEEKWTAAFVAKRLEYRTNDLKLDGRPVPYEALAILLLICTLSMLVVMSIDRLFIVND